MNYLERTIASISPSWALARQRARSPLQAYDAAKTGRTRKMKKEQRAPNVAIAADAQSIREQARHFDESYDLVTGILTTLVNNIVGPRGIQVEPQPKLLDGSPATELAQQLNELYNDYSKHPEVTGEHDRASMERLICRTWMRDGEAFGQEVKGNISTLDHNTRVPYSVEMIEPDLLPLSYSDPNQNIIQSIQVNDWNRPVMYHLYKHHPGEYRARNNLEMKTIPADRMRHLKHVTRIGQLRGISALASTIIRLEDLRDYEESERVAARVAAAMTAYIRKGTPDMFEPDKEDADGNRLFNIAPAMVWDDLQPGEEVSTIQSNRPSNLLTPFRDSMLQAASSGAGVGYSSASKNYSGTYAAQRQELVEQFVSYSANTSQFIGQWTRRDYQGFVAMALASRLITLPRNIDPHSIDDAGYLGPAMPWIDPTKEATANLIMVQAGFKSKSQVIRERGGNPEAVANEIQTEQERDANKGLTFSSDWKTTAKNMDALLQLASNGD